ncbi:right-handed parallel beta-helix repeat-containing protein [Sandarakinorhabdus oryzae]|uniref:right-handed parallel beta-helix repeat-containing protein n=1 Tax=Sandarakinorhabdus oryzae TaxID=2675220 RepID=UPI0018CC092D|nr:right-handed parallel beta-helix repeat-containing protein [Sandarakinorhabdus oryzae]
MTTLNRLHLAVAASLALASSVAHAQRIVELTPASNQKTVLASLQPGDTLRITGSFTSIFAMANRDFGRLTIDASGAQFLAGLKINNVHNVSFIGGTYGRSDVELAAWQTVRIDNSSHISFANATVIGNGDDRGTGLLVATSSFVTLRDSRFQGHLTGIGVRSSTDVMVMRNQITGSTADGINIIDNQRVIVGSNSCSAFVAWQGGHPDCIQLWSLTGRPLQADVFVLNNSSIGFQQGYLSSDPKTGSGTRLLFAGNYVLTSTSHGITCGNCTESQFFENVISNLPTAANGAPSLKLGPSPTNIVGVNQFYDLRGRTDGWLPSPTWSAYVPAIAGMIGSRWDGGLSAFGAANGALAAAAVPEPANWVMLGLGFALIGRKLRRRRQPPHVMA